LSFYSSLVISSDNTCTGGITKWVHGELEEIDVHMCTYVNSLDESRSVRRRAHG